MISHGGNHKWLQEYNPEKYAILLSSVGNRRDTCKTAKKQGIIYPNITSPEGNVYTIDNVRGFCREHNLDQSALGRVLNRKAISHKGWKLT